MGTYIIRDVQNFLIERWRRKQMDHEPTLDDVYSSKITRLREQNRVLRSNLVNCVARLEAYYGEDYPAVRDAQAALTATSQPGGTHEL